MELFSLLLAPVVILGAPVENEYIDIKSPLYSIEDKKETTLTITPEKIDSVVVEQLEPQEPAEPTLEEKIASNFYGCDTNTQWIREDTAECKDKTIYTTASGTSYKIDYGDTTGNGYAVGNCTWYVKSRRPDIPNDLGNANQWMYTAQSYGMPTGNTPVPGAIGQTSGGWLGHVVYVEEVYDNGTILISEMNAVGWNVVSTRIASASEFNYIY